MQVTLRNVTWSPGLGLHPKACAALGLEAEPVTPTHLGTPVPRQRRWHAFGTGYARKSAEPLGGDVRKQGGTPLQRDQYVTLAAISPSGVAGGRVVWGDQSGLAGCKPPPLFKHGASSRPS